MSRFDHLFTARLDELGAHHRLRRLRPLKPAGAGTVTRDGRTLINFSSNDYLGLAGHPALRERSRAWAEALGSGAGASRLVPGTLDAHEQIEAKVAAFKQTEAALIFASAFHATPTVLPPLPDQPLLAPDAVPFSPP